MTILGNTTLLSQQFQTLTKVTAPIRKQKNHTKIKDKVHAKIKDTPSKCKASLSEKTLQHFDQTTNLPSVLSLFLIFLHSELK